MEDPDTDDEIIQMVLDQIEGVDKFEKYFVTNEWMMERGHGQKIVYFNF